MVYTPLRYLTDVDDVVHAVLIAGGVVHGADIPADLVSRIRLAGSHYVSGHAFGGAAVHPLFLDRVTVSLSCWAATRRAAADVAATCRVLLFQAWRSQSLYAGASIAHYGEVSSPAPTPSGVDGVWRFESTYSLHVRT